MWRQLTEVVIGAAHRLSRAGGHGTSTRGIGVYMKNSPAVTSTTNHGDWAAANANEGGDILDDDTQRRQNSGDRLRVRSLNLVAALDGSGVALRGGRATSRRSNSKSGKSERDDRGLELHNFGRSWECGYWTVRARSSVAQYQCTPAFIGFLRPQFIGRIPATTASRCRPLETLNTQMS